jgi:hypothetical protein
MKHRCQKPPFLLSRVGPWKAGVLDDSGLFELGVDELLEFFATNGGNLVIKDRQH